MKKKQPKKTTREEWERARVNLFYELSYGLDWTAQGLRQVFDTLDEQLPITEVSEECPRCNWFGESLASLRGHIAHAHRDFPWGLQR